MDGNNTGIVKVYQYIQGHPGCDFDAIVGGVNLIRADVKECAKTLVNRGIVDPALKMRGKYRITGPLPANLTTNLSSSTSPDPIPTLENEMVEDTLKADFVDGKEKEETKEETNPPTPDEHKPKGKPPAESLTVERVKDALMRARGSREKAAEILGSHFTSVYRFLQKHPEIRSIGNPRIYKKREKPKTIKPAPDNGFIIYVENLNKAYEKSKQENERLWAELSEARKKIEELSSRIGTFGDPALSKKLMVHKELINGESRSKTQS
jgi:hypothetical protein